LRDYNITGEIIDSQLLSVKALEKGKEIFARLHTAEGTRTSQMPKFINIIILLTNLAQIALHLEDRSNKDFYSLTEELHLMLELIIIRLEMFIIYLENSKDRVKDDLKKYFYKFLFYPSIPKEEKDPKAFESDINDILLVEVYDKMNEKKAAQKQLDEQDPPTKDAAFEMIKGGNDFSIILDYLSQVIELDDFNFVEPDLSILKDFLNKLRESTKSGNFDLENDLSSVLNLLLELSKNFKNIWWNRNRLNPKRIYEDLKPLFEQPVWVRRGGGGANGALWGGSGGSGAENFFEKTTRLGIKAHEKLETIFSLVQKLNQPIVAGKVKLHEPWMSHHPINSAHQAIPVGVGAGGNKRTRRRPKRSKKYTRNKKRNKKSAKNNKKTRGKKVKKPKKTRVRKHNKNSKNKK